MEDNVTCKVDHSAASCPLPLILQAPFFKVNEQKNIDTSTKMTQFPEKNEKVKAQCLMCPMVISGDKSSTGNFYTHLRRKHSSAIKRLEELRKMKRKQENEECSAKSEDIIQRKKIKTPFDLASEKLTKHKVNELIYDYIIEDMLPILTVEKASFKNLISCLSHSFTPPCRRTTLNDLKDRKKQMLDRLMQTLNQVDYICTTADIWTNNQKSYMGVTCHYINKNLNRCSAVLACRRMKFSHTHLEIGHLLAEIHKSFHLVGKKLIGTVTDNASNFAKSFKVYSIPENVSTQDVDFINDDDQSVISTHSIPDFETFHPYTDTESDDDDSIINLPPHFRCCSHTLNLIATVDVERALQITDYKKIYNSTFAKLTALWNICHRSTNASDVVENICKYKIIAPCQTRWNSFYDSVKRILLIKEHLSRICESLQKPKLKSLELEFLEEYRYVMEPLAKV